MSRPEWVTLYESERGSARVRAAVVPGQATVIEVVPRLDRDPAYVLWADGSISGPFLDGPTALSFVLAGGG